MKVHAYNLGPLDNNTYLVVDEAAGECVIIDPTFESDGIWNEIQSRGWRLTAVLNTHAHIDHVIENAFFVERGAPLWLHPDDEGLLQALPQQAAWLGIPCPSSCSVTHSLADGLSIVVGEGALTVAHTPGHSPGSVSFLADGFAITGDALFAGSIGRTDLPGGNMDQLLQSIRDRLLTLPDATRVYPGHGSATTIGVERRTNPFL